jgi:hypothetical protein
MLGAGSAFNNASNDVGIAVMRLKKDFNTPSSKTKPQVQTVAANEWEEF